MKLFKRNKDITKNRKVNKARFLNLYIIFGSIGGLLYFFLSLLRGWPKHFGLAPFYLLIGFVIGRIIYKSWKLIWFYIINVNQGNLLLFLNNATHWEESHKIKVVKWVYLGRKRVREETYKNISKKAMDGEKLTKEEKKLYKKRVVFCPQQIKLGFNEALLTHALIYAHRNISTLDDDLRGIMKLTDENILAFDIKKEYSKAGGNEYDRLVEIGRRKAQELKN